MKSNERDKQIHIRVTKEEHYLIMHYALKKGMSAQRLILDALAAFMAARAKEQ